MFTPYQPLIVVALLSLLLGALHCLIAPCHFSAYAMGYFLCLLSMFKLFDLEKFADAFSMYDIIAKRQRLYAYTYPFIELFLGIFCIMHWLPFLTNLLMLAVMTIGTIGIVNSMRNEQKIQCACMGTALDVPLTAVSLLENIAMGLIALLNLF